MDSWGLNCLEGDMTNSQRRGLHLDLDLNYPVRSPLNLSLGLSIYSNSQEVQAQVYGLPHQQTTNAIEVLDDEVTIITPQAFAQARENSERNHSRDKRAAVGEATGIPRGGTAANNLCTNCKRRMPDDCYPCKPGTSNKKKAENVPLIQELAKSIPVSEEPIFSCAVCMGPLIEPTSTKCGHIFCKECLHRSLKSLHNKCPTCRQKVGKRGIFRVYLPTTN